jgi:hypothetical protein
MTKTKQSNSHDECGFVCKAALPPHFSNGYVAATLALEDVEAPVAKVALCSQANSTSTSSACSVSYAEGHVFTTASAAHLPASVHSCCQVAHHGMHVNPAAEFHTQAKPSQLAWDTDTRI